MANGKIAVFLLKTLNGSLVLYPFML